MALADDIITSINASLIANLSWLDNAYGKAQRLQRKKLDGSIIHYPGIPISGSERDYDDMLPGQVSERNYSYFEVDGEIDYKNIDRHITPSFRFKLVFWFYWPDVYADFENRSIEEVKAQVLNVLTAAPYSRMVEVYKISEDARSIYQGYTHQEIDQQFLMRPYGGFAIEGEVYGAAACSIDLPTPTIPVSLFSTLPANYSTDEQLYPLKKWFGSKIYWKTWIIGDGTEDYVNLTGLNVADVDIITWSEHRSKNSVDDSWQTVTADVVPNGSGLYKVFTSSQQEQNYVTLYYTKN